MTSIPLAQPQIIAKNLKALTAKHNQLDDAYNKLKSGYDRVVMESEMNSKTIGELKKKVKELNENLYKKRIT